MAKYIADNIFRTYDVAGGAANSTVLDLSLQQVFEVDNTTGLLTLEVINLPSLPRGKMLVVDVVGNDGVTFSFPVGVDFFWTGGETPTLGESWTQFLFMYSGSRLRGGRGFYE